MANVRSKALSAINLIAIIYVSTIVFSVVFNSQYAETLIAYALLGVLVVGTAGIALAALMLLYGIGTANIKAKETKEGEESSDNESGSLNALLFWVSLIPNFSNLSNM